MILTSFSRLLWVLWPRQKSAFRLLEDECHRTTCAWALAANFENWHLSTSASGGGNSCRFAHAYVVAVSSFVFGGLSLSFCLALRIKTRNCQRDFYLFAPFLFIFPTLGLSEGDGMQWKAREAALSPDDLNVSQSHAHHSYPPPWTALSKEWTRSMGLDLVIGLTPKGTRWGLCAYVIVHTI